MRAGVLIRAREIADIPAISEMMSDPGVVRGTLQVPFTSHSARIRRFEAAVEDDTVHSLVAETLDRGEVVGNLGIHRNTRPRRMHAAYLGMSVCDSHQGRGIGSALMAAAVALCDDWLQVHRLTLEVFVDNEPAIALYRKFGFQVEGTLRDDAWREGRFVDSYVMARLHD